MRHTDNLSTHQLKYTHDLIIVDYILEIKYMCSHAISYDDTEACVSMCADACVCMCK